MLLKVTYTKKFKKDVARVEKQGKDTEKLLEVTEKLIKNIPLPKNNVNHKLKGDFVGRRECHIDPDWLLIYKKTKSEIRFERTGSHSELFK